MWHEEFLVLLSEEVLSCEVVIHVILLLNLACGKIFSRCDEQFLYPDFAVLFCFVKFAQLVMVIESSCDDELS